jgi:glycerophosphoryl diester phosphodiesterase
VLAAFDDKASAYLDSKDISPEALAAMIRKYNLFDRHVVYQSVTFLEKLQKIEPRTRAMPPLRQYADLPKIAGFKPYAVDVNWNILSKQLIDDCHQRGILVFSDALGLHETPQHYLQAMEWGIDLIQTDHPLRVLRAIELHQEKR